MHPNCFPSIYGSGNGICKQDVRFYKAMVSFQISSGNNFKTMIYKAINIFNVTYTNSEEKCKRRVGNVFEWC